MKKNENKTENRDKYIKAIYQALRMLAKQPQPLKRLHELEKKAKIGNQRLVDLLETGKLVTRTKNGKEYIYQATEKGATGRFKPNPLIDKYRAKCKAEREKLKKDPTLKRRRGTKAKPGSQLRSTLLDAAKAATESARPAVVQLSLLEGTDPGGQLFTLTQAIDHLKAKGYKITREL